MKTKTIIKNGIVLLLFSMLSFQAYPQFKFGIKADVGLNNPTFSTEALNVENMTSYSIGPSLEAMFLPLGVGTFGIETALLYTDNRMNISNLTGDTEPDRDVSNRYLSLPVNAKIKFNLGSLPIKLFAAAGPYASYLISGDEINIPSIGDDIKAKSFQAGANIGFGVELFNMLQLGANYRAHLTDNYAIDTPDWGDPLNGKTDSWSITGTIYF